MTTGEAVGTATAAAVIRVRVAAVVARGQVGLRMAHVCGETRAHMYTRVRAYTRVHVNSQRAATPFTESLRGNQLLNTLTYINYYLIIIFFFFFNITLCRMYRPILYALAIVIFPVLFLYLPLLLHSLLYV